MNDFDRRLLAHWLGIIMRLHGRQEITLIEAAALANEAFAAVGIDRSNAS